MKITDFKIGDNLYKHGSFVGVIKYVITAINEDVMQLECLSCRDHDNCKITVKFKRGKIVFNSMLNNPNEYFWHDSNEQKSINFYRSYDEYAHKVSAISIGKQINIIKKAEKMIKDAEREKEKYINWLKTL